MSAHNPDRPLSALLSQTLVAFTVEFNNEFERRMGEFGHPGSILSLVVWRAVMRFLVPGGMSVRDLAAQAPLPSERLKLMLGCLERWRFATLQDRLSSHDGWGSGRGIRADWLVCLTPKGAKAVEVWRPLTDEIEGRWQARFGRDEMKNLRSALEAITADGHPSGPLALPSLLSRTLRMFATEFDGESTVPLALSANTLRVLSDKPTRESDISRLTGASPETSGLGWQIKRYVRVEPDPTAGRGKVVRLTMLGFEAQRTYHRLMGEIEKRWEAKFGQKEICRLRASLENLFERRDEEGSLLSKGLVPPPGVIRAGRAAPALGRKDVGTAARKRAREMVAQTEAFVRDPAEALPHYPLWDMNRGFGP